MEIYKVSFKNHLRNSWQIVIFLLATIVGIVIFPMLEGDNEQTRSIAFLVFGIAFLLQLLPQLALHLNYYSVNKEDTLLYDGVHNTFTFYHGSKKIAFNATNIKGAVLYKSFPLNRNSIHYLAWDGYNHCILELEDGKRIVITSLMMGGDIKLPIEPDKIKIKLNLFRWAPRQSWS